MSTAMELRNGSVYTPELNKHYYYSLSLSHRPKKSPKPKGHSLSRSVDRERARSAHSFNLDFKDSGGGGGYSSLQVLQEDRVVNAKSKNHVIVENQSRQEVRNLGFDIILREDFCSRSTKNNNTMKGIVTEEITEIKTSTTNYLSFSKKENLFLKEALKTSTPVQNRCRNQYDSVSYTNGHYSKEKQKQCQKFSPQKQIINTNCNEGDVFSNTLEDHIFHDTSYKRVALFESDQATDSHSGPGDDKSFHFLYKLNGSSLKNYSDISDDDGPPELDVGLSFVNHYKRSLSRQKRRDWYLNRRNLSGHYGIKISRLEYWLILIKTIIFSIVRKTTNLFTHRHVNSQINLYSWTVGNSLNRKVHSSYFVLLMQKMYFWVKMKSSSIVILLMTLIENGREKFMHPLNNFTLVSLFQNVLTGLIKFIHILKSTFQRVVNRFSSRIIYVIHQTKDERENLLGFLFGRHCCVSIFLIICALPFLLLFLTLNSQAGTNIIVDPRTLSVSKSQTIFLGTTGNSIPAWHFLPPSAKLLPPAKTFSNKSPVTLYLREGHDLSSDLQVNIFKTLVSLGYHVIVPVNILNEEEVSMAWSWIKEKAPSSSTYLWGDHPDSSTLTGYAKDFCLQLIPPDGVIIETEVSKPFQSHRSLEIWSCNCTQVKSKSTADGYHRYTHVKCPLSDVDSSPEDIYNHIVTCIAAVNKGTE